MASTTAEVLLHFQCDDPKFKETIDEIRFSSDPPLEARAIISLINPIYDAGYSKGYDDCTDEERG